jgi:hypothetical protein
MTRELIGVWNPPGRYLERSLPRQRPWQACSLCTLAIGRGGQCTLASFCCAQQTGMHIGCGSTAYSVGTVYRGKEHLYTPGVCPGLLATPRCFTGDHLMPHRRSPYASLAITLSMTPNYSDTGTRPPFPTVSTDAMHYLPGVILGIKLQELY